MTDATTPAEQNGSKKRKPYAEVRDREFLTRHEIALVIKAASRVGRQNDKLDAKLRNRALVLMGYRHALRASELVSLTWNHIDWDTATLYVKRLKGSNNSTQPIRGDELRLLRKLKASYEKRNVLTKYLFLNEEGSPLTTRALRYIIEKIGKEAGLDFPIHPHMLRHTCGHTLAEAKHDTRSIQDYFGHKSIKMTVRYTQGTSSRFDDFFV